MTHDPDSAIAVLQDGLKPDRPGSYQQADALLREPNGIAKAFSIAEAIITKLVFELAWTLLSQRRYQEAADAFLRMTEMNNW